MKLYRTGRGIVADVDGGFKLLDSLRWDDLFTQADLRPFLKKAIAGAETVDETALKNLSAPLESQEVWAAGVTYLRSKKARMEESKEAGGGDFYDRIYEAERPELFFKATKQRVVGPGDPVRVRADSKWTVPEPELALAVNYEGRIFGYTIGNDMSARDIEGENPLYLPQAKVYDGGCALGPALLIPGDPLPPATEIRLRVDRGGKAVFDGGTALSAMKRAPEELVAYLFRECSFPNGCYLLTGTGIVPEDSFTLHSGDVVRITIEPIGILENPVA